LSAALASGLTLALPLPVLGQSSERAFDSPLPPKDSVLKICKVAGDGVRPGTPFEFSARPASGAAVVSIPAGPAPGGWCKVVGTYPVGTDISVQEHVPAGYAVDSIAVEPAQAQLSRVIEKGQVKVRLGSGVTEITIVDSRRTGYIEICKRGGRDPYYEFSYVGRDGVVRKVRVPAGACSPALEVPAGELLVTELLSSPQMSSAEVWPSNRAIKVDVPRGQVSASVPAGDISMQTIITVTNKAGGALPSLAETPPRD
jgi:hypothetical protein